MQPFQKKLIEDLQEIKNPTISQLSLGVKEFDISVMAKVAHGFKIKEIAELFDMSYHTVSSIVEDLRIKLNAKNSAQLVAIFMSLDLIKYDCDLTCIEEKKKPRPPASYSNHSALKIAK